MSLFLAKSDGLNRQTQMDVNMKDHTFRVLLFGIALVSMPTSDHHQGIADLTKNSQWTSRRMPSNLLGLHDKPLLNEILKRGD